REEPVQWQPLLARLVSAGQPAINQQLVDLLTANAGTLNSEVLQNCRIYADRIQHHLAEMQHEVDTLLPWLAFLNAPPALLAQLVPSSTLADPWTDLQLALPSAPKLDEIEAICRAGQRQIQRLSGQITGTTSHETGAVERAQNWCTR